MSLGVGRLPQRRWLLVYESPPDPSRHPAQRTDLDGGEVLPDFRLPLSELFSPEPTAPLTSLE